MVAVSVFIPAYNEEALLERNVTRVKRALDGLQWDYELVIVDDGSHDRTQAIGRALARKHKRINYLRYDDGPSRRENLAKSFHDARGDIIAFMDADLSAQLSKIGKLISTVEQGYDIATGSRHIPLARPVRKTSRLLISHLFRLTVRIIYRSSIFDHECGFKAFRKASILHLIDKHLGYDKLRRRKMFWDSEMLLWAQKHHYRIKEIPISWKEGRKSALRISTELSMIPYMVEFWFRYWTAPRCRWRPK